MAKTDLTLERVLEAVESLGTMLPHPDAGLARKAEGEGESLELFGHGAFKKNKLNGGVQYLFFFPNFYGASVVRHRGSYGSASGLWELAVVRYTAAPPAAKWSLTYRTPITDDVMGRLSEAEVKDVLDQIEKLSKEETPHAE